ncbi:serine/threonine-protein kinase [Streptomyces sp. NBC_00669]|uniref:serine/threonine-protein kinase n=1 Tax=Streptomyces sp. NBC_00669 TaxID=2976011 RepID=UPI002E323B9A|nr:serine/threonine-protein kinase [Streptomyces sp. NBC_00669]
MATAGGGVLGDRYRLLRPLGAGGTSRVYEAEDLTLGRRVAVKVLAAGGLSADPVVFERFRREAETLARISSASVVRVQDAGADSGGTPFLVMELLDGVELLTLVEREGALPVEVVETVAVSICRGLEAVHEAGVVHRDVKPSNVMVTRSGRVVLHDFGLSRVLDNTPLTGVGDVVGTPRHLPPETMRGASPRPTADLYGLGTCMYTMLTGREPFTDEEEVAGIVFQVVDVGVPRLAGTPGIPERLAALVDALTERDAARRPASAAEVLDALPLGSAPETTQLVRDMVARCVRDQAVASVHQVAPTLVPDGFTAPDVPDVTESPAAPDAVGAPDTASAPAENPEYLGGSQVVFAGPRSTAEQEAAQWPATGASDRLALSGTTQQMVMSGMTEPKATSRLREAVTLVHRGDLQEAVRILGTLARVCPTSLGRDHPTTLAAQFWQAMCLSRLGAGGEAVALFSAVSERCEAERGTGRG